MTLNLPSGLSTSSTNPQSCGKIASGASCSKSWAVSGSAKGTYDITIFASSSNAGSATSSPIAVGIDEIPVPTPAPGQIDAVSISILEPVSGQSFGKGTEMSVKARLGQRANVFALLDDIRVQMFDDGLHNDGAANDLVYAGNFLAHVEPGVYSLIVRIDEDGKSGESSVDITIGTTLEISANMSPSYFKGQEISFIGSVSDAGGRGLPDAEVSVILITPEFTKNVTAKTSSDGSFSQSYYINFLDPEGKWTVRMEAKDSSGNSGVKIHEIEVKTPSEAAYYYVRFNSPLSGLTYSRGDEIPISVEVLEGETKITGADLSFKTPSGAITQLTETEPGVYSGKYGIPLDSPSGNYTISVFGYKTIQNVLRGGTGKIALTVEPATLKVELLTPSKNTFTVGEKIRITTRVLYPDGTLVKNGVITAVSPLENTIRLSEIEPGLYQGVYKLQDGEDGPWNMRVVAEDKDKNAGALNQVVHVNPITFYYLILRYWYLVVIGSSPFAYLSYRGLRKRYLLYRIRSMNEDLAHLDNARKELQMKYFKEGSIGREAYDNLAKEQDSKRERLRLGIAAAESKLRKR